MATKFSTFSKIKVPSAEAYSFGIVVSQWNSEITAALYNGAYQYLTKHGASKDRIITVEVPGSFELTSGADLLLANNHVDSVICLGCVVQGETRHFDYICNAVANGITQVSIKYNKSVIFGVLTTDNFEQAKDRAGGKYGNKGEEAAATAIQMAALRTYLIS
jgi:6,7-dimethyl-8-ribityllumazine synthase